MPHAVRRWRRLCLYAGLILLLLGTGFTGWIYIHYAHLEAPRPSVWLDDRAGRFVGQLASPDAPDAYGYWPLPSLPPRVEASVLALEDRRFSWHPGIDPVAVIRAAMANLRNGRRVSGASTIAMQIARMQFDRHLQARQRSWWRKGLEAVTALTLTLKFERRALLEHYLKITPFGNRSHGMSHASELYFDKPLADLSWAEIAFLAAIPNAPALNNPYRERGRQRLRARAGRNLQWLAREGVIDLATYAQAQQQLVTLEVSPRRTRPRIALHVLERMRANRAHAAARPDIKRVRLSLDLRLQADADEMLNQHIASWRQDGATNAAVMVVDLNQCAVRASLGSADYFDADHAGAIDHTVIPRSPGSTLKPFIYGLGLERHVIAPDSVMDDLPVSSGLANSDHRYLGPVLPRQALANSRNLPAVRLLKSLGVAKTGWALHRLGISDGRPADMSRYGLGLALGVMPVSLEQLMQAYTTFAHDGRRCDLSWRQSRQAPQFSDTDLQAGSARLVSLFLSDPQARLPTFKRLGATDLPPHIALKTGTSQNYRDAWTFAWSRDYLVGVWVGRHDARPMRRLSGATAAAHLVRDLVTYLAPTAGRQFLSPDGMQRYAVCAYTGDAFGAGCARPVMEWLPAPPRETSPVRVAVDQRTEQRATAHTPSRFVAVRTVASVPARFGPWLARLAAPRSTLEFSPDDTRPGLADAHVSIVSPADGLTLVRLPGVAHELQSIALRARSRSGARDLVWFVDGVPVASAGKRQVPRWSLQPGRHVFQVQVAGTLTFSKPVTVTVH